MPHVELPPLPGIVGLLAQYPRTGEQLSALADALLRGPSSLTPAERETIGAYVSARNRCEFCASTHTAVARHLHAAAVPSPSATVATGISKAAEPSAGAGTSQAIDARTSGAAKTAAEASTSPAIDAGTSDAAETAAEAGTSHAVDTGASGAAETGVDAGTLDAVGAAVEAGERADVGPKMQALLALAEKVRVDGRSVTDRDIERAREAGADDQAIHDTVLTAALFSMFNRYVDGLATLTPSEPEHYACHGQMLAVHGYRRPPMP